MRVTREASPDRPTTLALWGAIGALLLLPLVAMQFTEEVSWTLADFAVAAALLGGAGVAYEIAARRIRNPGRRRLAAVAIVALVAVIWAQGAVGLFD